MKYLVILVVLAGGCAMELEQTAVEQVEEPLIGMMMGPGRWRATKSPTHSETWGSGKKKLKIDVPGTREDCSICNGTK